MLFLLNYFDKLTILNNIIEYFKNFKKLYINIPSILKYQFGYLSIWAFLIWYLENQIWAFEHF